MTTPNGSVLLPAVIDTAAAGDSIIIPTRNYPVFIWRLKILLASETTVQFKAGTRALSGRETCTYQILDFNESQPWYVCAPGEAFIISLGSSVLLGGTAWYTQQ